ncbi:hypothetical protein NDU88_001212 [Pleurodeles waltl]|uniref:Uncharacterized protein n=1 Tax=Pleurodeles waltl TaxID=8319 RepID=A0AAV7WM05_PLEWA|nr:hypothetical protein NDU88_001212 [Pleurodeles waltl]
MWFIDYSKGEKPLVDQEDNEGIYGEDTIDDNTAANGSINNTVDGNPVNNSDKSPDNDNSTNGNPDDGTNDGIVNKNPIDAIVNNFHKRQIIKFHLFPPEYLLDDSDSDHSPSELHVMSQ